MNVIFIHSALDDFGLSPIQFRIFCHLARRAGANGAFPAVASMAKLCDVSERWIRICLRDLEEMGLLNRTERPGYTSVYTLNGPSKWKQKPEVPRNCVQGVGGNCVQGVPRNCVQGEGNPSEGSPKEGRKKKKDFSSSVPAREQEAEVSPKPSGWATARLQEIAGKQKRGISKRASFAIPDLD